MTDPSDLAPKAPTLQPVTALLDFFKWAMNEGPFDGRHLDGGDIQDKAESLGLIVATKYDSARHGDHPGFHDGADFYEYAPGLFLPNPATIVPEAPDAMREALQLIQKQVAERGSFTIERNSGAMIVISNALSADTSTKL